MRWGVFRIRWRRLNDLDPHHRLSSALDLRHPLLAPWGDLLRTLSLSRLLILHSLEHPLFGSTLPINQKNRSTPSPLLINLLSSHECFPSRCRLLRQGQFNLPKEYVFGFDPCLHLPSGGQSLWVAAGGNLWETLVTLLYNPAPRITCCATNWGGSGSPWPPTLLWRQVVPLNKAFVLFFFCCLPLCGQHDYSQFYDVVMEQPICSQRDHLDKLPVWSRMLCLPKAGSSPLPVL